MIRTVKNEVPPYYRIFLAQELSNRVSKNPRYSLRRFAEFLRVDAGPLSQILRGKRSPSTQVVERIFQALEISQAAKQEFIRSLLEEKKTLGKKRISKNLVQALDQNACSIAPDETADLVQDHFRLLADWYYLALWEMVERKDFNPKSNWIAKQLGISATEAQLAFDRLKSLNLIVSVDGRWKKTSQRIQTKDLSKTSEAHRRRQRQVLEKSIESLQTVPLEKRHHSAITINIDPEKIPKFREKMQSMLWDLAEEFKVGDRRKVYEIALQVFPLEKMDEAI